MPVGNISKSVSRATNALVSRNLRAEDLQQVAKKVVRRGVYEEEARRKREEAQTAQGMAAVALAANPINQRIQNVQQEEPARMSEQNAWDVLNQVSVNYNTPEKFNASGGIVAKLIGKILTGPEDDDTPEVKGQTLLRVSTIFHNRPAEFNASGLIEPFKEILTSNDSSIDIIKQALNTLRGIYVNSSKHFKKAFEQDFIKIIRNYSNDKEVKQLFVNTAKYINNPESRSKVGQGLIMTKHEIREMLKQVSEKHYTPEEFEASELDAKFRDILAKPSSDKDDLNIKETVLVQIGNIYRGKPNKYEASLFVDVFNDILTGISGNRDVEQKCFEQLGKIYQ